LNVCRERTYDSFYGFDFEGSGFVAEKEDVCLPPESIVATELLKDTVTERVYSRMIDAKVMRDKFPTVPVEVNHV